MPMDVCDNMDSFLTFEGTLKAFDLGLIRQSAGLALRLLTRVRCDRRV